MLIENTKIGSMYRAEEGAMKGSIYMVVMVDHNTVTLKEELKLSLTCIYSNNPRFPVGHSFGKLEVFNVPGLPKGVALYDYTITSPEIKSLFVNKEWKPVEFIPMKTSNLQRNIDKTVYLFKEAN